MWAAFRSVPWTRKHSALKVGIVLTLFCHNCTWFDLDRKKCSWILFSPQIWLTFNWSDDHSSFILNNLQCSMNDILDINCTMKWIGAPLCVLTLNIYDKSRENSHGLQDLAMRSVISVFVFNFVGDRFTSLDCSRGESWWGHWLSPWESPAEDRIWRTPHSLCRAKC